jgi:hypothetical protein
MALGQILDGIILSDDGTFTILTDFAVWAYDQAGNYVGGQAI